MPEWVIRHLLPEDSFNWMPWAQGGEESSHQWSRRIISPNSNFWSALTEHEWNWIQLLIWIVVTGMVIDYCHDYMNAWMYGSCSIFPCSKYRQRNWNNSNILQLNETRLYKFRVVLVLIFSRWKCSCNIIRWFVFNTAINHSCHSARPRFEQRC